MQNPIAKSNGGLYSSAQATPLTAMYPPPPELSQRQSDEAQMLQGKETAAQQYWQKDLHRKKEDTKSKTQTALAGRQRLNSIVKKTIKTE